MAGTYEITEVLNDNPEKFTCMARFNGGEPERYEVESLDAATIAETMQSAADASAIANTPAETTEIAIDENGQVIA